MQNICPNCNKPFNTRKRSKKFCSINCHSEYRSRPEVYKLSVEKRKKTCIQKYGVDNASKSEEVINKTKQTCIEKYGVASPSQNKEIKQKQKDTLIKNYGVDNPMKDQEIKNKMFNSCEEKFGNKFVNKTQEISEKKKKTCLKRYGVDNPSKSEIIKNITKKTCVEKYGDVSPTLNKDVKDKQQKRRKISLYTEIISGNRLPDNVIPLFNFDDYINNKRNNEYKFKCKECSNIFYDHLANGRIPRCYVCFPKKTPDSSSRYEDEIYNFISSIYHGKVLRNNYQIILPKEIDIYIPDLNIGIEFNGLYWHSELSGNKNKHYHLNKTKSCENKGIRLIHIFEDEWITKKEILKEKLKNLLSASKESIFARKCSVSEITSSEKNKFLNETHIQGEDRSSIKLGLFHENKLVSVMTFSNLRISLGQKNNDNSVFELVRHSSSVRVVGGASKLLSYFIKNYNPSKIISYADRRYSGGNLYEKLGFVKTKETEPNYWYLDSKFSQREYRYRYAKHKLKTMLNIYNDILSEWENMQLNGYDRIWDCGHLKYELTI